MFKQFTQHFNAHFNNLKTQSLNDLFKNEPQRYQNYQVSAADLTLDFCRQPITQASLKLLDDFYEATQLKQQIAAMFKGANINLSEHRPALHVALRGSTELKEINEKVREELAKMHEVVLQFQQKKWLGVTQKPITDIVNLGIGGSDLGPRMVLNSLRAYHQPGLKVHFVANVDAIDLQETLKSLNPATTLFIIASKSFSTQETLLNARTAKNWLHTHLHEQDLSQHFIGITAHQDKAIAWGIKAEHIFNMWDFVGGRYSLWSSIGLPIALQIGMAHFQELFKGAQALDQHFLSAKASANLPILLAFLSIMNQNFYGAQSHAILPYSQYLELLPTYLQQVDMESNGKQVNLKGAPVTYQTGVVLWGGIGTNGQHSFHQLLHQGTLRIPVDFILPLMNAESDPEHQNNLIANCLAQAEALRQGNLDHQLPAAQQVPGNRPANIIFMPTLNPKNLGALIALYEHKIFIESLIWEINAFDQWGVELGKQLALPLLKKITDLESITPTKIAQILA